MVDLSLLDAGFRAKVEKLQGLCSDAHLIARVTSGTRTPVQQAKLWRQGRTRMIIMQQIANFRAVSADYLADCLEAAGPQKGDWVTDALPGQSWHNYGKAVDFTLYDALAAAIKNGSAEPYQRFQKLIPQAGLFNYGKNWPKDAGHVQAERNAPMMLHDWAKVSATLEKTFPLV